MRKKKLLLGIILFIAGLTGVLSMLTMEIQLPADRKELLEALYTPEQLKLLILLNPTILLIIATVVGVLTYDKVGLKVPLVNRLLTREGKVEVMPIIKQGVLGGLIAGVLLSLISWIYGKLIPEELEILAGDIQPTIVARFLYGGITEEILMRFGLMSLIAWLIFSGTNKLNNSVYWSAIIISAILFAVAHFGVLFTSFENPGFTLISYIILGNSAGGIVFGWLYWKRGLECAMIAHIITHVVMLLASV